MTQCRTPASRRRCLWRWRPATGARLGRAGGGPALPLAGAQIARAPGVPGSVGAGQPPGAGAQRNGSAVRCQLLDRGSWPEPLTARRRSQRSSQPGRRPGGAAARGGEMATRRDIADVQLECVQAAEAPARQPCHDIHDVPFADRVQRGRSGRSRCRRARLPLCAASSGCARRWRRGRAPRTTRRCPATGVHPRHHRGASTPRRVRDRRICARDEVEHEGPARIARGRRLGDRPRTSRHGSPRIERGRDGSRLRRRGRRTARTTSRFAVNAAPRSKPPALRAEPRHGSTVVEKTTAGRPSSSASRPATRPMTPGGHGPATMISPGHRHPDRRPRVPLPAPRSSCRAVQVGRLHPALSSAMRPDRPPAAAPRTPAAWPTRPSALMRGARPKEIVSGS